MAILAEAISVILKKESIEEKIPGGMSSFNELCSKNYYTDNEILQFGFLSPVDTQRFIQSLEDMGLTYLKDNKAVDMVVTDQQQGLAAQCEWIQFGRIPWGGDDSKLVPAVKLRSSSSNQLMVPDGWDYEKSLTKQHTFVESGRIPEYLDFLRTENGLDVYRDLRTGKEVYINEQSR